MISIEQITYLNEIGQRPQLEDSIYPAPGKATVSDKLFMVCDGVGGENMGEEASRIACEGFSTFFEQNIPLRGALTDTYIRAAQTYVLQQMRNYTVEHPEAQKMSTTLTLAYLNGNNVSVAWCGDSRIYHLSKGEVIWRSADHSLVGNLVRHGEITEEEARIHPQRNIITRALSAAGEPSEIETHIIRDVQDGDYIMLCSDGVLEQITDGRLKEIALSHANNKRSLFMEYCSDVTKDNFSLYLLKLNNDSSGGAVTGSKKMTIPVLLSIVILLVLAILFRGPIKKLFKSSEDKHEVVISKKSPESSGPAKPADKNPGKKTGDQPNSVPASNQKRKDTAEQKVDTVKELNVSVAGKNIKIKASISKTKRPEKKQAAGKDSTNTDVAAPDAPQN
ncbi:MAG: serine/threonine-protein phosphatase [Bacteroidetes bacterium]|jgi:protein phosphatase|nr:serine/threonine-protein phosphatase [Bacteroidota bacterium]